MGRARFLIVGLLASSAVLRGHNAWFAPPLSGFDGPYHVAYAGVLFFEGRLPLPHEGWSTFHPPLYYALVAGLWALLPEHWTPQVVLFTLRLLNVLASLALGLAVCAAARTMFPARTGIAVHATAIALFVPMLMGPSYLLGNEMLSAALCALAVACLLHCLAEPASWRRVVSLGVILGAATLTKFGAWIVLAVCVGALLLVDGLRPRISTRALRNASLLCLVVFVVSGWYYARNLALYGQPALMQNEIVTEVMRWQGYGATRPLMDYLSTDLGALDHGTPRSPAAGRAVWPMTFAATWFDPHGTTLDVTAPAARGGSLVLYACGLLMTAMTLLGGAALATRRVRSPLPGAVPALLALATLMLLAYGLFTWRVATDSALKASYLSPALAAFALAASVGLDLASTGPRAALAARSFVLLFVGSVTALFWVGWLAPLAVNPATLYLRGYRDPPTERVAEYFLGPGMSEPGRR